MNWFVFLLVYLPLSYTNEIDYSRPPEPDWPTLTIQRHYGDTGACHDISLLACAVTDFDHNTCDIYYPTHPPEWLIKHEEAHCAGYDHNLDNQLHLAWAKWKQELLDLQP